MSDTTNNTSSGTGTGGSTNTPSSGDTSPGTMDQIVAKASEMKDKAASLQGEIEGIEKEGEAAGGMVKAVCDGNGTLKSIKIDPSLMDGEAAVLEELIVNAVAHARKQAQEEAASKVGDMLGGLPIPTPIANLIGQFLPSQKG